MGFATKPRTRSTIMKKLSILIGMAALTLSTAAAAQTDGVTCANDLGSGVISAYGGEITCLNGEGSGWSSGSEGGDPVEPVDPGAPDTDTGSADMAPPEEWTDEELYAMCMDMLESTCVAPPVLEEVCDPSSLDLCTAVVLKFDAINASCAEEWGTVVTDDTAGSEDVDIPSTNMDTDVETDSISAKAGDDPAESEANPWHVAACCDVLASEDGEWEIDFEDYFACVLTLGETDCDAATDCDVEYFGEAELVMEGMGEIAEDLADNGEDGGDEDDGDDRDESAAEGDDDASCSVARAGAGATRSLISLLISLF